MTHWLTTYDPDNGEPIGSVCWCEIGDDHDGDGDLMDEFGEHDDLGVPLDDREVQP